MCPKYSGDPYVRPHGSLGGLTPYEAFTGQIGAVPGKEEFMRMAAEARAKRIEENRNGGCVRCAV